MRADAYRRRRRRDIHHRTRRLRGVVYFRLDAVSRDDFGRDLAHVVFDILSDVD